MATRGSRVLIFGATLPLGRALCEAFLAMGAHVVAADRVRTRLDALRAGLGQHERLDVAECDPQHAQGVAALLADVARRGRLDSAVWVGSEQLAARAVLDTIVPYMGRADRGRLLMLTPLEQFAELCGALGEPALAVCVDPEQEPSPELLTRALALADPSEDPDHQTVVVGDVHGCVSELRELMLRCAVASHDRIVFVGDLVAKGPDSRGVLALVRQLGADAVRGNHDQHLLNCRKALQSGEADAELSSVHLALAEFLEDEDWAQLEALPAYLRINNPSVIVVHAGLVPGTDLEHQDPYMLMNVRTLREDGSGSKSPDDGKLWGEGWRGPELVVFGHHARKGLQRHPYAIGLDTGCVYGGALSALILPEQRIVSVPAERAHCRV